MKNIEKIAQEIIDVPQTQKTEQFKEVDDVKALNVGELKKAILNAKDQDQIAIFLNDGVCFIKRTEAHPGSFHIITT